MATRTSATNGWLGHLEGGIYPEGDHLWWLSESLVDKAHEELRNLESLQFCFPVETTTLGTFNTSLLQHSSFVASGRMGVTIRGESQINHESASVFIIFGRDMCAVYVKMM